MIYYICNDLKTVLGISDAAIMKEKGDELNPSRLFNTHPDKNPLLKLNNGLYEYGINSDRYLMPINNLYPDRADEWMKFVVTSDSLFA